ncbi:uncharacterized protein LOC106658162 isoform X2 [Trichogramma pretiosum]|nr:uncharacterized protein LOC106658162 isoform X2 [Trichogramma pretiosum]XP_023316722.1 uncharacterized protein LOC106658162 isoform X2 [Trichogramma pretiosum]
MYLKLWIFVALLVTVAYAALEPLELEDAASAEASSTALHSRQKRFIVKKIIAKKALLAGGAVGLGLGLIKGKKLAGLAGGLGGGAPAGHQAYAGAGAGYGSPYGSPYSY